MSNEFKPGEKVEIVSGGPAMTVLRVEGKDSEAVVTCQWYDKKSKDYKSKVFEAVVLRHYRPRGGVAVSRG